ncbi:hypothetical protein J6590_004963 [Homalodisca vitripennis]|nr:hypothetical protein J6590_004963 [Homalodisca vitripennis]
MLNDLGLLVRITTAACTPIPWPMPKQLSRNPKNGSVKKMNCTIYQRQTVTYLGGGRLELLASVQRRRGQRSTWPTPTPLKTEMSANHANILPKFVQSEPFYTLFEGSSIT